MVGLGYRYLGLWKNRFFGSWAILGLFSPLKTWFFDIGSYFQGPIKSAQGKNFEKIFFGNFQKISKVSKNIFWASYDHVVAQKSIFWTKISKKVVNTINPPPRLATAVICIRTTFSAKFNKNVRKFQNFLLSTLCLEIRTPPLDFEKLPYLRGGYYVKFLKSVQLKSKVSKGKWDSRIFSDTFLMNVQINVDYFLIIRMYTFGL